MAKILKKEILAPNIKKIIVEAPEVAKKAQPGQFVILRIDEKGERIPLTIGDFDREKGTLTIVFQEVGKSTYHLGLLNEGDEILDFVGPLGKPSEIEKFGTVCCIGGGVGTPEIYPVARALKEVGNYVISIIGARNKELVIMEKEMREVSDELYITTDDGTYGMKGFVTDALKKILDSGKKIDRVIAVGPVMMMKAVSELTKNYNIKTIVSLNAMMLDGTGMCGICRVEIGGETKFACVDGPEFDGHLVNYDLLMARLRTYLEEEKLSLKLFKEKMGIQ
ncbi:MAG: sulfide/dihydroorotate dehydrogenase-like FAD/NAD-binding protein [candidate division WOR-3 bacterium]|nr:sulfide/dihydroorotate dehydrogenase-like FAD/NAD-binding protein [candidate division WOR-3 bacterium]MDW8114661.1 sulfide/dihydroorotate dehydrogenase-like FAD/NAD-binding protein [candidate division WOR-3 bacterium]